MLHNEKQVIFSRSSKISVAPMCCQRKFNSSTFIISQSFTHYCSLHLHMWCDWNISGITLFLSRNTYFLISVVGFQVISCGLHTVSPVIIPLSEAFCNVHCSDFGKWIPEFYLNHGNITGFFVTKQNLFINTFERNFGSLSSTYWKSPACVHMILLLLLTQHMRYEFGGNQFMFRLSLKIVWTDPNQTPRILAASWMVIFLQRQVPSLDPYFHVFCWLINVSNVQDFQ